MKKRSQPEYKRSDFTSPLIRGKYAKCFRKSSNIVVLKPEVAMVFSNEKAVNDALLSLIEVAKSTTRPRKRFSERAIARR